MERFGPLYMEAIGRRWCWRLGVASRSAETDAALVAACEADLRETGEQPDAFFYRHRGGREAEGSLLEALREYEPVSTTHSYWTDGEPQTMLIDEVEAIWDAIAERDDWDPLKHKISAIRRMGEAHGEAPAPAGT